MKKTLAPILMTVLLAACTSTPQPDDRAGMTLCPANAPRMCTMDYRPVCARLESGEEKTYANACGACSDSQVVAHREQACE